MLLPCFNHVKGGSHADYDIVSWFRLPLSETFLSGKSLQATASSLPQGCLLQPFCGTWKRGFRPFGSVRQESITWKMHKYKFRRQHSSESMQDQRIGIHKVFKGIAQRGKCSMGWFFGFKLHLICNEKGELLNFMIPGGIWAIGNRWITRLSSSLSMVSSLQTRDISAEIFSNVCSWTAYSLLQRSKAIWKTLWWACRTRCYSGNGRL